VVSRRALGDWHPQKEQPVVEDLEQLAEAAEDAVADQEPSDGQAGDLQRQSRMRRVAQDQKQCKAANVPASLLWAAAVLAPGQIGLPWLLGR
jgi:hypothetical protein